MRTTSVIIKSNAYGLILFLDPTIPYEELRVAVAAKFKDAARFFRNAQMALTFKGRELSEDEERDLLLIIMENSTIDIVCIVDENEEHAAVYRDAVIRAQHERAVWKKQPR